MGGSSEYWQSVELLGSCANWCVRLFRKRGWCHKLRDVSHARPPQFHHFELRPLLGRRKSIWSVAIRSEWRSPFSSVSKYAELRASSTQGYLMLTALITCHWAGWEWDAFDLTDWASSSRNFHVGHQNNLHYVAKLRSVGSPTRARTLKTSRSVDSSPVLEGDLAMHQRTVTNSSIDNRLECTNKNCADLWKLTNKICGE